MRYSAKPRILILADYFLPGFKAGGPIRSLANLVEQLGTEFEFRIITRDRDVGDAQPYSEIFPNRWRPTGKAEVLYLSPPRLLAAALKSAISDWQCEAIYLNSFFSPVFTIQTLLLKKAGFLSDIPVILAPRGELSSEALQTKAWKKRPYLHACRLLGLCRDLMWQASSPHEEADVRRYFGAAAKTAIALDLSVIGSNHLSLASRKKEVGRLRLAFIARITPHKNLIFVLHRLTVLSGEIEFNIYGPVEDRSYWAACQTLIRAMPKNVQVTYRGELSHPEVLDTLSQHHLLFLPTRSESFGHVIAEALVAGCPVLISNQTPWRGLSQALAGWELPLHRPELFEQVLRSCVAMDDASFARWSSGARAFAGIGLGVDPVEEFRSLLGAALTRPHSLSGSAEALNAAIER